MAKRIFIARTLARKAATATATIVASRFGLAMVSQASVQSGAARFGGPGGQDGSTVGAGLLGRQRVLRCVLPSRRRRVGLQAVHHRAPNQQGVL